MELLQIRFTSEDRTALLHELKHQLQVLGMKEDEVTIHLFRHESIQNDICCCIIYRGRSGRATADRLGNHLAICLKPFGETYLSTWIEESLSDEENLPPT